MEREPITTRTDYFSDREWLKRANEIRALVHARDLDLFVITSTENIFYLTGFHTTGYYSFQCLVVPRLGESFLVVRKMETLGAETQSWVQRVCHYVDTEHPIHVLRKAIQDHLAKHVDSSEDPSVNIGIEQESALFPPKYQDMLFAAFPLSRCVDVTGMIELNMRITKCPTEIGVIRMAATAAAEGMRNARNSIQPGVRDNHIAAAMYQGMFLAGGEYPASPSYVAVGKRGQIGHATWNGTIIRAGDVVFLEIGASRYRYHAAMMRTFFVGTELPPKLKDTERLIVQTLDEAMDGMRPGVPIRDVDALSKRILNQNPYGCTYDNRLGYSMGCAFAPGWGEDTVVAIVDTETRCFQEGMVFHVLPFLMIPGVGTVGISETVIVTESGGQSLFLDESGTPLLSREIVCLPPPPATSFPRPVGD